MSSVQKISKKYIRLFGGLDLASPPMLKTSGSFIAASNVEALPNGGFRRVPGYDRFDGSPSPSHNKSYYQFVATAIVNSHHKFSLVSWSGGSGVFLYSDGACFYICSDVDPALSSGDAVTIEGYTYELARRSSRSALTRDNAKIAAGLSTEYSRTKIGEVPGIGNIRGVVSVGSSVFAFRDSEDLCVAYKATKDGWKSIADDQFSLGTELTVRNGYGIDNGASSLIKYSNLSNLSVIAQLSADGVEGRVCLPIGESCSVGDYIVSATEQSYSLSLSSPISGDSTTFIAETVGNQMSGITIDSADNAGWYVDISGYLLPVVSYLAKDMDSSTHVLSVSNQNGVTIQSDSSVEVFYLTSFCEVIATAPITLPCGGDYKAVVHNFYGSPDMRRAYVVNGVGRAFELSESGRITPIFAVDDAEIDKPILVESHKEHLFLCFRGGQFQHSAMANPLTWSGLLGAEAFSVGDEITAIKSVQGGALIVGSGAKTTSLSGSGSGDWVQSILSEAVGVQIGTLQSLFVPIGLSKSGLVRLDRVQEFGNFSLGMLDPSEKIGDVMSPYTWVNSGYNSERNQYFIYSTSGINICATLSSDGTAQFTTFRYKRPVVGVWQYDNYTQRQFIALDGSGYVYEIDDEAYSFDGEPISWGVKTSYLYLDTPGITKSWRNVRVEQGVNSGLSCNFWWSLDHKTSSEFKSGTQQVIFNDYGLAAWNLTTWNQFYWNSDKQSIAESITLGGVSESISFTLSDKTSIEPNFVLSSLLIEYIQRRYRRG